MAGARAASLGWFFKSVRKYFAACERSGVYRASVAKCSRSRRFLARHAKDAWIVRDDPREIPPGCQSRLLDRPRQDLAAAGNRTQRFASARGAGARHELSPRLAARR